jgi:uncharacterized membrane protein
MTSLTIASTRWSKLNIGLWTAQGLLALAYLAAGGMKTFTPIDTLVQSLPYAGSMPNFVRFIGTMEILGAIGLILPSLTRILPKLTPAAAVGLSVVQLCAIPFHAMRGEAAMTLPVNLLLLGMSLFVLWGRMKARPITPRS